MQVPAELLALQKWFAKTITHPLNEENPFFKEAFQVIRPNERLSASQRIEIYNQQYWWRLLTCMQENYPTLVALFGYDDFNLSLAIPFLTQHPSRHWSLNELGGELPQWIETHYREQDKALVYHSASIDAAYVELFLSPKNQMRRFELPFDLFSFRRDLLKQPPHYWLDHDFPLLKKGSTFYFVLYRNENHLMCYREIER